MFKEQIPSSKLKPVSKKLDEKSFSNEEKYAKQQLGKMTT